MKKTQFSEKVIAQAMRAAGVYARELEQSKKELGLKDPDDPIAAMVANLIVQSAFAEGNARGFTRGVEAASAWLRSMAGPDGKLALPLDLTLREMHRTILEG